MPEHQPQYRERPDDLETKDTRGSLIGYNPSPVPHITRTGSELTEDERRRADQHGDWTHGGSGVPEADADQFGITTESGGTQSEPAVTPATKSGKAAAAPKA